MNYTAIAKNASYQFAARVFTSAVTFATSVVLAAKLGAAGYGAFATVTTVVGFGYLLVDFGLNALYLQKDAEGARGTENKFFRDLLYARLLAGISLFLLLLAGLGIATAHFGMSTEIAFSYLAFSLSLFAQAILITASAIFQKRLLYSRLALATAFGSIVSLVLILLPFFSSLPTLLLGLSIGNLITAIVALLSLRIRLLPIGFRMSFISPLIKQSAPLGIMLIVNLLYFRADIILLSLLRSPAEVGMYGWAYRVFDFFIAVPTFLSNAIYPSLLLGTDEVFLKGRRYFMLFFSVSLVCLALGWFIAPFFVLISGEFADSLPLFRILLFSLPFFFLTSILQWMLIARRQLRFLFWAYVITGLINVMLNLLLIPSFGATASAVITLLSEGAIFITLYVKYFSQAKNIHKGTTI